MSLQTHVLRVPLAWTLAPEVAALLVRDDERPFALIGRWAGGGALIGSEPVRVASAEDDPFALLDEQPFSIKGGPEDRRDSAVAGGWFGALPYELGRRLEPVGPAPPAPAAPPPAPLAFYDHLLHRDHAGHWWFEALWTEPRAETLRERLHALEARAATPPQRRPFSTEAWCATPSPGGHALAVDACRERIHAGDLYQANICIRLESRLEGDPLDLFLAGVSALRPARAAFFAGPEGALASLSPELFLERHGRRIRSAPIKGTRPRPRDPRASAAQRTALLGSEKDRAENVMIVDLVRNDLGRVCKPGSVRVDELADPRAHTGVWHLVSEVSGVLRDRTGDGGAVRAAFPPGSVTGAPKIAAMNVIAELESTPRGVYTGAIGFASPVSGLELNVAIRTFEFLGERAWLGVGGGIVADSEPPEEAAECVTKAQPLLRAIGARLQGPPRTPRISPPPPRRPGPLPVPRPDPAAGVFETLLVAQGCPVLLERHLERIARSARTLYGAALPSGLETELLATALHIDRARIRVDVRPCASGIETRIEVTDTPGRSAPVPLSVTTVPGGVGCHKWADRRLLAALAASADGEPLLCDLDGLVLEAGRANVFVVQDGGTIITPPADGRILPGVTRAVVLELGHELGLAVHVEPIDLALLAGAREIFLTGALGGVEPAHLDGRPAGDGRVTAQLADALRTATQLVPSPAHEESAI
jgi:para-aminobenzoate synthetase / 4-amino-4-deoxychorismate lyase